MNQKQYPRSVEKITILEAGPSGVAPVTVYKSGGKKSGSKLLRPIERLVRRVMTAEQAAASSYMERHNRSNEKKKNGWLRDMGGNVFKAMKVGAKKVRPEMFE